MEINKTAGMFPVLCLIGSTAMAEGLYLGARVGVMDPDVSGLDDATNAGVVIGYTVGEINDILSWGFEGEVTTTVSDGDVDVAGFKGDWDIDTQAIYAVFRVGETIYGKLRFGALREDVSINVAGVSVDGDDSSFTAGIGAGWRFTDQLAFEAEFTNVESDVNFYSVGVNYSF